MKNNIKIKIYSFGYSFSGIPSDKTGNNGGFVFDCRFLPNPFHVESLRKYNGLSNPIINYFKNEQITNNFLQNILSIIKTVIAGYEKKGYENLFVAFGCTGGFHRSVYCSQYIFNELIKQNLNAEIIHTELKV